MSSDLRLNPFTDLILNEGECRLIAPRPGYGLTFLSIPRGEYPDLYDLVIDLSRLRLDFLDIENDLNDSDRNLLYENGILVEEDKSPQKPMFACQLDDVVLVDIENVEASSLIVNPTFHFDSVNLSNFNSYAQGKNLLPYQSVAWIKTIGSDIEIGFWVDENEAEIISGFEAGQKASSNIGKDLLGKLVNTEILISPKDIRRKQAKYIEEIGRIQKSFKENSYATLPSILPDHQMNAMKTYYRDYVKNGFMPFADYQVKKRYYQHNEPLAMFLHGNLNKLMSLVVGESVKPSYVFAASYVEDAVLTPHVDRTQCEFSFSFQIDYLPESENHISPWALFVDKPETPIDPEIGYKSNEFPAKTQADDQNNAVFLANGDALAYKGCELVHYRYPLPKGHKSTSLFFHYVPVDFEGELD